MFIFLGALKNLRESTTNEKVKKYHKDFYKPENLCIIIAGQVKHAEVFKSLQPVEEKIMSCVNIYSYFKEIYFIYNLMNNKKYKV